MRSDEAKTENPKWMSWTGRAISGLVTAMLIFSAVMKFIEPTEVVEEFARLGWADSHTLTLGILEAVCTVVYAIPQTAVLGAILLTGYLGGAIATHVRIDDQSIGPVVIGVLVWLAVYLREPRLRALLPWRR